MTGFLADKRAVPETDPDVDDDISFKAEMVMALFHNSPDAIIVVNGEGIIEMANSQAELLLGWHRNEMLGNRVEMLLPEGLREIHEQHRAEFLDDPRTRPMGLHLHLNAKRMSGSTVQVDINLSPVVNSRRGVFVIATIRRKRDDDRAIERPAPQPL